MFWKKKKGEGQESSLDFSFDLDRREYYRVKPGQDKPTHFRMGKKTCSVADISAGGVAYYGRGKVAGDKVSGVIHLPGGLPPVPVIGRVVKVTEDGVTACVFEKIREDDRETLHQFVLECQKEEMERQRAAMSSGTNPESDENQET